MEELNFLEIGNRIRKQRELLCLSREQLAEHLDVSTKFCSDIEIGAKGMSIQTLSKLSQILHISTDYILFGSRDNTDTENLIKVFNLCPANKIQYAEDILKSFIKAVE